MAKERKGKKLRRCGKLKNYYAAQPMRTATNKKRRMRNHIRSHPADKRTVKTYEFVKNFGSAAGLGLNSIGRKRALALAEAAAVPA
jgi:hypothetical protein